MQHLHSASALAPLRSSWPSRGSSWLLVGALASLAGCATAPGGDNGPAAAASTASTPAGSAGAPAQPATPVGLGYDEVAAVAKGPLARARQDLVGQTVSLNLQPVPGRRGASTGNYEVKAGDSLVFRCLSSARGFNGGTVTSEVRALRAAAKGPVRTIDLARCDSGSEPAPAPRAERAAPPPPAPATSAGAGTVGAGKPGMDARGNVVDSSKVESGSGRTVKGINDYEGEITGNPAPGSKFTRLQIGMPVKQVTDLIGQPTDQGAYVTGKAWIPFYFGGDRHRFELVYKGQGRLIFAGGGLGNFSSGNLIWIIHNSREGGYR